MDRFLGQAARRKAEQSQALSEAGLGVAEVAYGSPFYGTCGGPGIVTKIDARFIGSVR